MNQDLANPNFLLPDLLQNIAEGSSLPICGNVYGEGLENMESTIYIYELVLLPKALAPTWSLVHKVNFTLLTKN